MEEKLIKVFELATKDEIKEANRNLERLMGKRHKFENFLFLFKDVAGEKSWTELEDATHETLLRVIETTLDESMGEDQPEFEETSFIDSEVLYGNSGQYVERMSLFEMIYKYISNGVEIEYNGDVLDLESFIYLAISVDGEKVIQEAIEKMEKGK